MTAPNLRQRNAIRTARSLHRAAPAEWLATPKPRLATPTPAPQPSLGDRFAAWCWRLHDGMPAVWALLFALLLIVSGTTTVLIAAMAFGWRP